MRNAILVMAMICYKPHHNFIEKNQNVQYIMCTY